MDRTVCGDEYAQAKCGIRPNGIGPTTYSVTVMAYVPCVKPFAEGATTPQVRGKVITQERAAADAPAVAWMGSGIWTESERELGAYAEEGEDGGRIADRDRGRGVVEMAAAANEVDEGRYEYPYTITIDTWYPWEDAARRRCA